MHFEETQYSISCASERVLKNLLLFDEDRPQYDVSFIDSWCMYAWHMHNLVIAFCS